MGIEADVLVVSTFDELERRKVEAVGKIVVFDAPFTNYGQTVQYRSIGAIRSSYTTSTPRSNSFTCSARADNAVAALQKRLDTGSTRLAFSLPVHGADATVNVQDGVVVYSGHRFHVHRPVRQPGFRVEVRKAPAERLGGAE